MDYESMLLEGEGGLYSLARMYTYLWDMYLSLSEITQAFALICKYLFYKAIMLRAVADVWLFVNSYWKIIDQIQVSGFSFTLIKWQVLVASYNTLASDTLEVAKETLSHFFSD